MKQDIKVTVAVPIYGVEKYIERCAVGLFEQTYSNIEYIFVNDCTCDNSMGILKSILDKYPERKKQVKIIVHEQNKGLGAARNTAIKYTTGEFVMWVDSDDYIHRKTIEVCVKEQSLSNADIVTFGCYVITTNNMKRLHVVPYEKPIDFSLALLQRRTHGAIWGRLIRTKLYVANNVSVKEGVNMGEDYQVMPKLAFFSNKLAFLDEPFYFYDCSNNFSYTNMYSEAKLHQDWESFDIVKSFFASFQHKYDKEINLAELKLIITNFVFFSRYKGLEYYYVESIKRLRKINATYWKYLPLPERLLLYFSKWQSLLKIYAQFATSIKHIFELIYFKR